MPSSVWSGSLTFSLITIPVRAETAVRSHDLSFGLYHQPKGSKTPPCKVKLRRVCERDGKEIPWKEVIRGREMESGELVFLDEEDFEKARLASSKSLDIQDFVPESDVDPRHFEKPYFLVPQKGGDKPYALLREAMRSTQTMGIGTVTIRQKTHLVGIKVVGQALVMETMRFADELVEPSEVKLPEAQGFGPKEIKLAEQIIEGLSGEFEPEKYRDQYRENLEKVLQAKSKGKSARLKESPEPEMGGVIDLQERLAASLKEVKKSGGAKKSAPKKRKSA